jgi:V-type H+-transporting ATPase subunit a
VKRLVEDAHGRMALGGACVVDLASKPWPTPPTSFQCNAFCQAYQDFVDTYGVPRYKEVNPALFTALTFPFLYGVMYGDVGHGACVLLFGLYLVATYKDDPKRGEIWGGLYSARYMVTMMGAFSVYIGMLYNDLFALPMQIAPSGWGWNTKHVPKSNERANATSYYGDPANVYPFGVDPAWRVSTNELLMYNSMKMKTSVILGILQMNMGIFLRGLNALYFKQKVDFYLEVVPMMLFAYGMFGYMVVIIFVKWTIDWNERMYSGTCNPDNALFSTCDPKLANPTVYTLAELCKNGRVPFDLGGSSGGCQPPNIITTLINIALSPGAVDEPMYPGQAGLQVVILLVAFLSVPVLLLGKPFAIRYGWDKVLNGTSTGGHGGGHGGDGEVESQALTAGHDGGGAHEEHDFTEVLIHQGIETIEFVLGMVSNTASYLRLWALSLAHSELSLVFWGKAMKVTVEMDNPVAAYMGYGVWAATTFAVILCMDVLECFLHALRLHWVEFQNKFYKADGYKFKPFALEPLLRANM